MTIKFSDDSAWVFTFYNVCVYLHKTHTIFNNDQWYLVFYARISMSLFVAFYFNAFVGEVDFSTPCCMHLCGPWFLDVCSSPPFRVSFWSWVPFHHCYVYFSQVVGVCRGARGPQTRFVLVIWYSACGFGSHECETSEKTVKKNQRNLATS